MANATVTVNVKTNIHGLTMNKIRRFIGFPLLRLAKKILDLDLTWSVG
jgi:hypothetical protein